VVSLPVVPKRRWSRCWQDPPFPGSWHRGKLLRPGDALRDAPIVEWPNEFWYTQEEKMDFPYTQEGEMNFPYTQEEEMNVA
jgi:hypothetical protein